MQISIPQEYLSINATLHGKTLLWIAINFKNASVTIVLPLILYLWLSYPFPDSGSWQGKKGPSQGSRGSWTMPESHASTLLTVCLPITVPPLDKRQLASWPTAYHCVLIKHNVWYDLSRHLWSKCNSRNMSWSSEFCMAPLLHQQILTVMFLCIICACAFSAQSQQKFSLQSHCLRIRM